jgi:integrase/recombinase XerD
MTTTPRRAADRAALRLQDHQEPRRTKRAAVITPDQLAVMLQAASPRDAALLAVMAAGACRIGEATLLTWADIDAAGTVTIPGAITKTGRSRAFTLPPQAGEHLDRWRLACPVTTAGWLFPGTPIRHPLSVRTGQRAIQRLADAAGIPGVSSHSLRRSILTTAHQAGLPMRAVAELSGHASLRELERYLDGAACRDQAEEARSLMFTTTTAQPR